jgi:PAS domain S-box-containing protein
LHPFLQNTVAAIETGEKSLVLFVNEEVTVLKGHWDWEFFSDIVFCSEVILSDYKWFEGTKAIVHPEDVEHLQQHLRFLKHTGISTFQFRVITTYGEIKQLKGEDVTIHESGSAVQLGLTEDLQQKAALAREAAKEAETMNLVKKGMQLAEQTTKTGTWFINTVTSQVYYSDEVYRIYGLPPQSLNPHLNTFSAYIHLEDAALVSESFDKAYAARLPLHLQFRIIAADGVEKNIKLIIQWRTNDKAELVLHGIIKDISLETEVEYALEKANSHITFSRQLEKLHDQVTNTGHWMVDLLTRNTTYSDNFYRIFGLKPQLSQVKPIRLLDYVYHEDREIYQEAVRAMYYEHTPPEIEFRIIRSDGKLRLIKQSAKLEIYGDSSIVMLGVVEDITQHRNLEKKARAMDESTAVMHFAYDRVEEVSKTGTLMLDLQTNITTWSSNLFRLLGYKPNITQPDTNQILKYVHPNDRKRFSDEVELALNNNGGTEFTMHFYRMGELRYFSASFKLTLFEDKRFLVGTFRDVTDEQESVQLTAEKVQLVDLLTTNILDRVMITDQSNSIQFWNKECENIFKLRAEQVLRRNIFEVLPQLKNETVLNDFKEALQGKQVHQYHVSDVATKRYIDLHMLPLKNEHDEVYGILHVIHDVTDEYELKQDLTQRLGFIENILETTVDRIKVLDKNLNFIYWNSRAEVHHGIKKRDAIGKNILEVFPGLQNNQTYYHLKQALKGETIYLSPEQGKDEAGQYYQVYFIPVKNNEGEVTSVLWITHDFSKEYQLLEQQKKAYNILDNIEEACYELDGAGNVLFVNRMAELLWNKSREELLNNNIWQLFPEAVDSALYFAISHVLESKQLVQQEILSPILNRKVFINITPTSNGVIVAFVDLHKRKVVDPGTY